MLFIPIVLKHESCERYTPGWTGTITGERLRAHKFLVETYTVHMVKLNLKSISFGAPGLLSFSCRRPVRPNSVFSMLNRFGLNKMREMWGRFMSLTSPRGQEMPAWEALPFQSKNQEIISHKLQLLVVGGSAANFSELLWQPGESAILWNREDKMNFKPLNSHLKKIKPSVNSSRFRRGYINNSI